MKLKKLVALGTCIGTVSLVVACGGSEQPAQQPVQPAPAAVGQPPAQAGYGQPVAAPAPQPVAAQPAPVAAAPAPVAAAPAAAGTLSPPGPLAPPCSADGQCGTAHCNIPAGKCVFPCANDNDCLAPNHCMAGVCLPAMPGQ